MDRVKEKVGYLIQTMERKLYKVFLSNKRPFNLNIIGVRSSHAEFNRFCDQLIVFWRYNGELYYGEYPITTLPGEYYLVDKLLNRKGAAILVPGQYIDAYCLGTHRGKYQALVQQKPVKVYRDGDRDKEFDFNTLTIEEGLFGLNIHKAYKEGKAPKVGNTSAGCQVFQNAVDFKEFMECCANAVKEWGNSFTYTLLEEQDLVII